MKKFLTLIMTGILALSVCFGLTACSSSSEIGVGDGKLVIGYTLYPPMNYYDDDNNFVGFDTELAQEVCKVLNVECEFVEINWKTKLVSLNSKEIDVVWNGMTITDELKESMCIVGPYYQNKQVIVCRASDVDLFSASATKKGLDKDGLTIFTEGGSAGEATVQNLGLSSTSVGAQRDVLLEIKSSANRVAVIDELLAAFLVGEGTSNPDLAYVDVGFDLEYFGIGVRKNDVSTAFAIEKALDTLKENGTFARIQNKYFH